jgi:hypothetical protein
VATVKGLRFAPMNARKPRALDRRPRCGYQPAMRRMSSSHVLHAPNHEPASNRARLSLEHLCSGQWNADRNTSHWRPYPRWLSAAQARPKSGLHSQEPLFRRKRLVPSSNRLPRSLVTASAGAAAFTAFRMQFLIWAGSTPPPLMVGVNHTPSSSRHAHPSFGLPGQMPPLSVAVPCF